MTTEETGRERQLLQDLEEGWVDCHRCDLCKERTNVVFGEGNPKADILVIGEGPGQEEDELARPFMGESGRILDQLIEAVGWERADELYITNVVCCRPTQEVKSDDGKLRIENRPPSKSEREACRSRLLEIIYIVDPLLILALGKVPTQALLGKIGTMESMHGKLYAATLPGRHLPLRYSVMPVYHPAFLLRSFDRREEGSWGLTAKDFARACQIVDHLRRAYYGIKVDRKEIVNGRESR